MAIPIYKRQILENPNTNVPQQRFATPLDVSPLIERQGRAIESTANTISDVAFKLAKRDRELKELDVLNNFAKFQQDLLQNENSGLLFTKGKNAIGVSQVYDQAVSDYIKEVSGNDPKIRGLLTQKYLQIRPSVLSHEARERFNLMHEQMLAFSQNTANDIKFILSTADEEDKIPSIHSILEEFNFKYNEFAESMGYDKDFSEVNRKVLIGKMIDNLSDYFSINDVNKGLELLEEVKKDIPEETYMENLNKLNKQKIVVDVTNEFNNFITNKEGVIDGIYINPSVMELAGDDPEKQKIISTLIKEKEFELQKMKKINDLQFMDDVVNSVNNNLPIEQVSALAIKYGSIYGDKDIYDKRNFIEQFYKEKTSSYTSSPQHAIEYSKLWVEAQTDTTHSFANKLADLLSRGEITTKEYMELYKLNYNILTDISKRKDFAEAKAYIDDNISNKDKRNYFYAILQRYTALPEYSGKPLYFVARDIFENKDWMDVLDNHYEQLRASSYAVDFGEEKGIFDGNGEYYDIVNFYKGNQK